MENEFYKTLNNHTSIRKYKKQNVPVDVLDRILEAATRASTSGNMQAYSIIVTTDEGLKKELYEPHFEQNMVLDAPVLLTFCADFYRMRQWLKINEAPENFDNFMSFMIASIDAILASQNAALAAEHEGLGVCYMGTTLASCNEIAKILKCPEHVVPVVGFSLGYPDESPKKRERLPLSAIIHKETYNTPTSSDITKFYSAKESEGYKRYKDHPELNSLIEKFGAKNLAQIYTKVKYTKESHIKYSTDVLNCLVDKKFMGSRPL